MKESWRFLGVPRVGFSLALICGVFIVFSSVHTLAQLSTATVNGVVRDPSGAVVPKTRIDLKAVDTAVDHTTVTNDAGAYTFTSISPGKYTIEASASGFSPEQIAEF